MSTQLRAFPAPTCAVQARENKDGGSIDPRAYQTAESAMQWDGIYKSKVADWKGIGHLVPVEGEEGGNPDRINPAAVQAVE